MDTYRCENCLEVFEKAWTDEEAIDEKQENFGLFPIEDCAVVCDDCYQKIMQSHDD